MKKTSKVLEAHYADQIRVLTEYCNEELNDRGYPADDRTVEVVTHPWDEIRTPLKCGLAVTVSHSSGGAAHREMTGVEAPSNLTHTSDNLPYADLVRNKAALVAYRAEQRAEVLAALAADYDAGRLYRRNAAGQFEAVK